MEPPQTHCSLSFSAGAQGHVGAATGDSAVPLKVSAVLGSGVFLWFRGNPSVEQHDVQVTESYCNNRHSSSSAEPHGTPRTSTATNRFHETLSSASITVAASLCSHADETFPAPRVISSLSRAFPWTSHSFREFYFCFHTQNGSVFTSTVAVYRISF